jgi:hypothetical protein
MKWTYVFEVFTATDNNINFLDHEVLQLGLCGAEMSLLLDPLTVLLCVRLLLKAMCASVCICLCEAAFRDDGKTSLKLFISL